MKFPVIQKERNKKQLIVKYMIFKEKKIDFFDPPGSIRLKQLFVNHFSTFAYEDFQNIHCSPIGICVQHLWVLEL